MYFIKEFLCAVGFTLSGSGLVFFADNILVPFCLHTIDFRRHLKLSSIFRSVFLIARGSRPVTVPNTSQKELNIRILYYKIIKGKASDNSQRKC